MKRQIENQIAQVEHSKKYSQVALLSLTCADGLTLVGQQLTYKYHSDEIALCNAKLENLNRALETLQ